MTVSPWKVRSVGAWRTVGGVSGNSVVTRPRLPPGVVAFGLPAKTGLPLGIFSPSPQRLEHVYDVPEWTIFGVLDLGRWARGRVPSRCQDCGMTACTEQHSGPPSNGLAGEGQKGMTKEALP